MPGNWEPNRIYQCTCCKPSRQIYFRMAGKIDKAYHEKDHSPAQGSRR